MDKYIISQDGLDVIFSEACINSLHWPEYSSKLCKENYESNTPEKKEKKKTKHKRKIHNILIFRNQIEKNS